MVQAQYILCNGTNTVRGQTRVSRYIARAGHARTLYKGYKHSTHCARIQAQYEYKHSTSTSTVRVQAQYECKHSTSTSTSKISTSPVLATPNPAQVAHAQYIRASNTHVYYTRHPGHHAIYCTTHVYTFSRRVVRKNSREPKYQPSIASPTCITNPSTPQVGGWNTTIALA